MSEWLNNPASVKYCTQCGASMRDTAHFCSKCGAKMPEPPVVIPAEAVEAPVEVVETPAEVVETPAEVVETPAEVVETPVEVAETPTEPAEVAEAPAEVVETPAEVVETPAEVVEAPAEAVETPAEPVETPAEPAETPVVPLAAPTDEPTNEPVIAPVPAEPPTPSKPPKKKGGAVVAILATACAVLLLGMTVMTAWALTRHNSIEPATEPRTETSAETEASTETEKATEKPTEKPTETQKTTAAPRTDVPAVDISDETVDDGLSAKEIVARNLNSTVVLKLYKYTSTKSYFFDRGEKKLEEAGTASGVIMSSDGYIITNAHCVCDEDTDEEFDRIAVTLYSGEEYDAEIIGYDTTTDLAVIKIDAKKLTPATFGDSSALALGDRVVVLGNGAGFGWSCTQGIVSGLGRDVYEDTGYAIRCIQTDAIINPGNSGGALLNTSGQVVGINSAKIVASGYEGIGFSIPINESKKVIDDLLTYGYVKGRVAIGITGGDITLEGYEGFMIESIADDSSLKNTEARPNDIIVQIDDAVILGYSDLRAEMAKHKAGDVVTIKLRRIETDRSGRYITSDTYIDVKCTLQESNG